MAIAPGQKYHQPSTGFSYSSFILRWCHWEIQWCVLCRGNRCELFSRRELRPHRALYWGWTGGFQMINGGPESWRNRVTHWEGIKEQRSLCLKSSWAGVKDVSKSWGSSREPPRSSQLRCNQWKPVEHLSDTPGEIPGIRAKSWRLFQLSLSQPADWPCKTTGWKMMSWWDAGALLTFRTIACN